MYGGAFIVCWINQEDRKEAEVFARTFVEREGWHIQALNRMEIIARSDYDDGHSPLGLASFEEAYKNGSCFRIHTYPNEALPGGAV